MLRAPGEARNTAIAAMSSGVLARRIGMPASCSAKSCSTVMPRSAARDRVPGAELGPRDARADGIDVDVEAAELLRRHLGQRDNRSLARRISGIRGAGVTAAADRGDVDDPAAAAIGLELANHLAGGALQAEEDALGINPMDAVPIRLGQ